jgi:predicted ATPase
MSALGLRDQPGRPSLEALVRNLSEKHMLLVFDNCEHLIHAVAESVERLTRTCPRLRVLTTSREVLNVAGEVRWQVQSLPVPPPGRALPMEELARYEAVALFEDRAGAVSGSFQLTSEMAPALADVCQRLDGIPLAIELAASRLKVLSLTQVRDRLDDRFGLLAGGSRTALPRQQTLRATIDWSHQLLSSTEQALLRRLSVFSGGCSLDAVEAICAGDPLQLGSTVDVLTGLVDKSLILVEPSPASARYRFLDTIRDYARERLLAEAEAESCRNRHFEWFVALAVEARARLHGPDQLAWLSRLENEHDNLRAAFDRGCAQRDSRTLVMASSLDYFWMMRGYLREGYEKLSKVIAVCQEPGVERAEALTHAARLAAHQAGDYPTARELSLQSLRIRGQLGVSGGLGFALMCLGGTEVALGNVGEGLDLLRHAVAAARDESEPWQLAQTLNDCALCSHLAGDRGPEPWTMLEQSVAIFREIGDDWSLSGALDSLALIAFDEDASDQARLLWAECGRIALRLAEQGIAMYALDGMARVAVKSASYGQGLGLHAVAARLRRETGQTPMPDEQASVNASIAAARQALGDREADRVWRENSELGFMDALSAALTADDEPAAPDLQPPPFRA